MQTLSKERYLLPSELSVLWSCLLKKKSEEIAELRSPRWCIAYYCLSMTYHLGLRVSELRHIQHKDIDLQSEYPSVFIRESKFKKSRHAPVSKKLQVLIKQYVILKASWGQSCEPDSYLFQSRRGGCYSIGGLEQMFLSAMKEAGLPRKTIHSLRHSFGFSIYNQTKDIRATQQLLNHMDIRTTQIYTYCTFDKLSSYVNQI